jgi:hypothetical protein
LRNSPHERGNGVAGFGKRFISHLGQRAIKETIQLGVSALGITKTSTINARTSMEPCRE